MGAIGTGDTLDVGRSPVGWVAVAVAVATAATVIAVLAFWLGASIGWSWLAWVLAGPAAIGLLARYTITDTRRRALPLYDAARLAPSLYWTTVVVAFLGIGFSAWTIAEWWARL